MNRTSKLIHLLVGLLLASALLALSVTFTLHLRPLYVRDLRAYDLPAYAGMSEEDILRQYDALIDYNSIGGPEELVFPDLPASEGGLTHFAEVKVLFMGFQYWAIFGTALSALCIFLLRRQRPCFLRYAGAVSLVIPLVLGGAMLLFWDRVFVLFHELVFRNDLWLFDWTTDPIILLLPDQYFMHCGILIAALFLASGVLCLVLCRVLTRNSEK